MAQLNGEEINIMSSSVSRSSDGLSICGEVQHQGTYCPTKRYLDYTSSAVVSAPSGCEAVESVSQLVSEQTEIVKASGLIEIEGFVQEGETVNVKDDVSSSSGGSLFGSSGAVDDVTEFVEAAVEHSVVVV